MAVMSGTARVHVAVPPEPLYEMVTDITRMGEWSPETYEAEWVDGATGPAVGARFRGRNRKGRLKWSTKATVTATDPGREFGFETGDTRWRYQMQPSGGGTDLVESFETFKYGLFSKLTAPAKKREPELQKGIEETLQRLKAAAEGTTKDAR